jgi:hypothetical protein
LKINTSGNVIRKLDLTFCSQFRAEAEYIIWIYNGRTELPAIGERELVHYFWHTSCLQFRPEEEYINSLLTSLVSLALPPPPHETKYRYNDNYHSNGGNDNWHQSG